MCLNPKEGRHNNSSKAVNAFVYHHAVGIGGKLPHPLNLSISSKRLLRSTKYFAYIKPIHKGSFKRIKKKIGLSKTSGFIDILPLGY